MKADQDVNFMIFLIGVIVASSGYLAKHKLFPRPKQTQQTKMVQKFETRTLPSPKVLSERITGTASQSLQIAKADTQKDFHLAPDPTPPPTFPGDFRTQADKEHQRRKEEEFLSLTLGLEDVQIEAVYQQQDNHEKALESYNYQITHGSAEYLFMKEEAIKSHHEWMEQHLGVENYRQYLIYTN